MSIFKYWITSERTTALDNCDISDDFGINVFFELINSPRIVGSDKGIAELFQCESVSKLVLLFNILICCQIRWNAYFLEFKLKHPTFIKYNY